MKKILSAVLAILLLAGCSDAVAKIKKSENYFKVGKQTFTSQELYQLMFESYGADTVAQFVNDYIYEQIADSDVDLNTQIEEELIIYREEFGEDYYSMFGYTYESDLINLMLEDLKNEAIVSSYIRDYFNNIIDAYLPTKMAIAQFPDFESASTALKLFKEGQKLEDLTEKYGITDIYDGATEIFSTESELPFEVSSYGLYATDAATVDSPIPAGDGYFYIVQVVDVNRFNYKEEIIEELATDEAITSEAILFYCRKFKLTYYDKAMIDLISNSRPEYLP